MLGNELFKLLNSIALLGYPSCKFKMLILDITKEIIKWIVFRKGWRFVLIAFVIAILDTILWSFFTGDIRVKVPIGKMFMLAEMIYIILFVDTAEKKQFQSSEQELRWFIRNIYNKKPYQVNFCIILVILSTFNVYIEYVVRFISSVSVHHFPTIKIFRELIFDKILYGFMPTCLMASLFKTFLKTLMTSVTVFEILSSYIYVFLLFTSNIYFFILLVYLCCNNYHKTHVILFSRIFIKIFVPICLNCGQMLLGAAWCQNCGRKYSAQNSSKWTSGNEIIDEIIKKAQFEAKYDINYVEWIPYDEFDEIEQIGKGGCGTVYSAVWKNGPLTMLDGKITRYRRSNVAIKTLDCSANITELLHELKANLCCSASYARKSHAIMIPNSTIKIPRCYGLSQNPITKEYLLVMKLGNHGDLFQYLQSNFLTLKWFNKLSLLNDIASGLKIIHEAGLVHHDLHPGNVIIGQGCTAYLSDLGLSCPVNEESSKSGIYGVLTFLAPEVLRGGIYTTSSDVYSFGMIMWVLTSGQNPFSNIKRDNYSLTLEICRGKRPPIMKGTPDCYLALMKRCWSGNPLERPSASEIEWTIRRWILGILGEFEDQFIKADDICQTVIQVNEGESDDKKFEPNNCNNYELSTELLVVYSSPKEYSESSSMLPIEI